MNSEKLRQRLEDDRPKAIETLSMIKSLEIHGQEDVINGEMREVLKGYQNRCLKTVEKTLWGRVPIAHDHVKKKHDEFFA